MPQIILKEQILVNNIPYAKIECNTWLPSVLIKDGIEVFVDDKKVNIPINNVLAIIE